MLKEKEEKLQRQNLLLSVICSVNQLLIRERDAARLLQGICTQLVQNRGYHNAWIILLEGSEKPVVRAEAGLGQVLRPLQNLLAGGGLPECVRQALKQPGTAVIRTPFSDCKFCPLRCEHPDRNGMTVRLGHAAKHFGTLTVSIPQKLIEDAQEHCLLEEMAEDIGFALNSIALEQEKKKTEGDLHRTVQELTERTKELQESEKRFRDLVENSLTGISIIQDNRVIYQNLEQERLLGPLPRNSILGEFENIHPEDVPKVKRLSQDISSGKIRRLDLDFRLFPVGKKGRKGAMKWVNCRAVQIDFRGRESILANMIDITKTKELEQLLIIQDKMASLGRVAAGIAHEIRNPLSGINIYLNTLGKIYRREENRDKVELILDHLKSASGKIESVIRRVMDFSKPGEPKFFLIDINLPVTEAVDLTAVTLRKSGIKIETNLAAGLPRCRADRNLLEEMVVNLITNAAEAMKKIESEKKITITTAPGSGSILLTIDDSGPGVREDIRDKIFDPFFTTKPDSTGIGLSLCHRIVSDHGGVLTVSESELGGASFRMEIPAAPTKGTQVGSLCISAGE
ncbi:MAG: ATP-binding protein [Desulfobacterales bacterium]